VSPSSFVLFFFVIVFLFILLLVLFLSKLDVGISRTIRRSGTESFWMYSAHIRMVRPLRLGNRSN